MKKYWSIIMFFGLIFCFSLSLKSEEATKYTNESFARISSMTGRVYVERGAGQGLEDGVVNMPIEEGNAVATTDGRAEIHLGKRNYVRLDHDTKLEILNLPNKESDVVRLRVEKGNIYCSVNRLDKEKTLEIHTADASCYLLAEGVYRVDVRGNKKTDVYVFSGLTEVAGANGSTVLKSEQRLSASGGRFDFQPSRFMAVAEDGFDRWNEERESATRVRTADGRLPRELEEFEAELDEYGDWVYLRPYGWVWVPRGVDEDWRPYYNGRWTWLGFAGWTWIPYEPWGWVPFHYGRWGWGVGLGWYWIPTSIWGPAWVSWWWDPFYWGWAPLSWWGYPCVVIDGVFWGYYPGDSYPVHSRALTVIRKDQLQAKKISEVALRPESLKSQGLEKMTLTARQPDVRPSVQKAPTHLAEARQGVGSLGPKSSGQVGYPSSMRAPGQTGRLTQDAGERRIRTTTPLTPRSGPGDDRAAVGRRVIGYPSSPDISRRTVSDRRGTAVSRSIRGRFYDYLQGSRSSSSSSRSSSSRTSVSRGSSSSGSRGSISSGSRGGSSGSRSSGSRSSGGSVRRRG